MAESIWSRNNPLTFYGNESKIDELITRIFGEVYTSIKTGTNKGKKANLKLGAKFGGFLSKLGLGEASVEGGAEFSEESIKEKTAKITFESKLDALKDYCNKNESFPYINVLDGISLVRDYNKPVPEWKGKVVNFEDIKEIIGQIVGHFSIKRIIPRNNNESDIAKEVMERKEHLWLLKSIEGSKIKTEIPILLSNIRSGLSQSHIISLHKSQHSYFKIEALGLIIKKGLKIEIDPVAWRLFH